MAAGSGGSCSALEAMRRRIVILLGVVVVGVGALALWFGRSGQSALRIVPIRHLPANEAIERLVVAVTNTTVFWLSGYIGQGLDKAGGSQFDLAPRCGCLVDVYGPKHGPWLLRGSYHRQMSNTEFKIRLFLRGKIGLRAFTMLYAGEMPTQEVRVIE